MADVFEWAVSRDSGVVTPTVADAAVANFSVDGVDENGSSTVRCLVTRTEGDSVVKGVGTVDIGWVAKKIDVSISGAPSGTIREGQTLSFNAVVTSSNLSSASRPTFRWSAGRGRIAASGDGTSATYTAPATFGSTTSDNVFVQVTQDGETATDAVSFDFDVASPVIATRLRTFFDGGDTRGSARTTVGVRGLPVGTLVPIPSMFLTINASAVDSIRSDVAINIDWALFLIVGGIGRVVGSVRQAFSNTSSIDPVYEIGFGNISNNGMRQELSYTMHLSVGRRWPPGGPYTIDSTVRPNLGTGFVILDPNR